MRFWSLMNSRLISKAMLVLLASAGMTYILFGCTQTQETKQADQQRSIIVGAAASMRFAFEEIGPLYEQETGTKVTFVFGSSGDLAKQITAGAPIDLFAAANRDYIEDLIESGHIIQGSQKIYAVGRIVLAVNKKSGLTLLNLEDLLADNVDTIALANPNHAPYGMAAKGALENTGIWERVAGKIVYAENISQAQQFVATGNAPVGIIALAVANVPEIDYALIDENLHSPLEQMLGVVKNSARAGLAGEFADYLQEPHIIKIMEKWGFNVPQN
ncbi:MAG: molybdate ABC transporter substrate-binding protein [Bacillota bacterium]